MAESIYIDLVGCSRCHGDGHPGLLFQPLTFPIVLDGEPPLTHWTMCPSFKEPILMRIETEDRLTARTARDFIRRTAHRDFSS